MPKIPFSGYMTDIFWNADSWLPEKYQDPSHINYSLAASLSKRYLYGPSIKAYGDKDIFTDELLEGYYMYDAFHAFDATKGTEHERLYMMLVDIVIRAASDKYRQCKLVIISKLSQDSEMISRVLGSLKSRRWRILFALPELDVDQALTSFGITVWPQQTPCNGRIPVWLRPNLFDQEWPPHEDEDDEKDSNRARYFIEPPAPADYIVDFSIPDNVDTCVFWDVEDYPLPPGLQPSKFYKNIISAFRRRGRVSSSSRDGRLVSIYSYSVKEEELLADSFDSGIIIHQVCNSPADKIARLARITMDFLLWSMDNPAKGPGPLSPPNLLVISKLLEDDILRVRESLLALKGRGHNVLLALPAEKIPVSYNDKYNVPLLSWEALSATSKRKTRAG